MEKNPIILEALKKTLEHTTLKVDVSLSGVPAAVTILGVAAIAGGTAAFLVKTLSGRGSTKTDNQETGSAISDKPELSDEAEKKGDD